MCGWTVVVYDWLPRCLRRKKWQRKTLFEGQNQRHERPSHIIAFTFWPKVMPLKDKATHRRTTQEAQCWASTMGLNKPHWYWDLRLNTDPEPHHQQDQAGQWDHGGCDALKNRLFFFLLSTKTSKQTSQWISCHILTWVLVLQQEQKECLSLVYLQGH